MESVRTTRNPHGSTWNLFCLHRIRADLCGFCVVHADSVLSMRIRAEHLGECKVLFQSMMDKIFDGLASRNKVIIYMDDILIFAQMKEELEKITKEVLQVLQENDLYLKPEKCEFAQEKLNYLGFIIEEGKISMDPTKIQGLKEWPEPKMLKQLWSFLGFGNFYRRFIKRYSDITRPLNFLLQKKQTWDWTDEQQKAFDESKQRFTEEPVLTIQPFELECDASKYALGMILTQKDSNGNKHPVAFLSQSFNAAEWNYEIYDRELLAIVWALEEWRHYVQGAPTMTNIYSDHLNLTYFCNPQKLNWRQPRWSLLLTEYDLKLIHLPGSGRCPLSMTGSLPRGQQW